MKQQARAVQARWAGEKAVEEELREFFSSLELEKALKVLADMRHNCEIAGTILNARINEPNIQRCEVCKKSLDDLAREGKQVRGWRMDKPRRDPQNVNITLVQHFCSDACLSMYNNTTQGVRGIPDRGMLRTDNPKNHPREAQE